MLAFVTITLKHLTKVLFQEDVDIWWFILIAIILFAPTVWIRTLETFRYGYIYSWCVIIAMVATILYFDSVKI